MYEVENAKITGTSLGFEDHGFFTFSLCLDYGGSGQCVGGYCLDDRTEDKEGNIERTGTKLGMDLIMLILKKLKVDTWESLVGKFIKVKHSHCKISGICDILGNDWLIFDDFFKGYDENGNKKRSLEL